jgi:hypothetical protein
MQAGGDSSRFSGTSVRKGGTSTAIDACADEASLYLQSGHGATLPGQGYMWIAFPARFLETFAVVCCLVLRPLGHGWDGEVVVRR